MESMLERMPDTPRNASAEAFLSKSNNPGQAGGGYSLANIMNVKVKAFTHATAATTPSQVSLATPDWLC